MARDVHASSSSTEIERDMPIPGEHDISVAILRYLAENPGGMDTLEGIARFWVLRQRIENDLHNVQRAIEGLVEEQFVLERILHDGSGGIVERYYRLNTERLESIQKLLKTDNPTS